MHEQMMTCSPVKLSEKAKKMPPVQVPFVALDSFFDPDQDVVVLMKMDVEGRFASYNSHRPTHMASLSP